MKKLTAALALLLALAMLSASALAEGGATLANALPNIDSKAFDKYASYFCDETTGAWSVRANEADAGLAQFDVDAPSYNGIAYFYLELTGDSRTGMLLPVLNICYLGYTNLNAVAASFRIGDARYDVAVLKSEPFAVGARTGELMRCPLDANGVQLLRAMLGAESVQVRLHGDAQYNMTLKLKEKYNSTKEQLESSSLSAFGRLLVDLDSLGMSKYRLWDVNAAYCLATYGAKPRTARTAIDPNAELQLKLDEDFEMLSRGDNGKDVVALQKQLIARGFMQGAVDNSYGRITCEAVKRAQTYYGLLATGSADRALLDCLFGDEPSPSADEASSAQAHRIEGVAELRLERFWFASAVSPGKVGSATLRSCANADNRLLIADGYIKNISTAELNFLWQLSGSVTYAGQYEYPCTIVCERDGGSQFDSAMLPLAESRLVIYAEIPASIAYDGEKEWSITINAGDEHVSYALVITPEA